MDLFFAAFLKECKDDFRRIARASRGEVSADDLQQEAWIMAKTIGLRQRREFDFSDPADQDYILGALFNEYVKWGNPRRPFAFSLDREYENDDSDHGATWVNRLAAIETSDPLVLLELRESLADDEHALASSYSQAAAWLIVFAHFDHDRRRICAWLLMADSTLHGRVRRALDTVRVQASLFDGVEAIPDDFMPMRGRGWVRHVGLAPTAQQAVWAWF